MIELTLLMWSIIVFLTGWIAANFYQEHVERMRTENSDTVKTLRKLCSME